MQSDYLTKSRWALNGRHIVKFRIARRCPFKVGSIRSCHGGILPAPGKHTARLLINILAKRKSGLIQPKLSS
jgi:hypothetical protein